MIPAALIALALCQTPDLRPADPWARAGLRPEVLRPLPEPEDDRWRWTTGDTVREVAVLVLIAVDWRQTRAFRADGLPEMNPVLGRYPSRARVNRLIGSAMVAHPVVARLLPRPWRQVFQVVTLAGESAAVGSNWALGYPPVGR